MKQAICTICLTKSKLKIRHRNFEIYECPKCEFIFVDPEQIGKDYLEQYKKDLSSPLEYYNSTQEYDKKTFLNRLMYLKKFFPNGASLLEIGSSIGTFLIAAKELGWKPTGVEPNKKIYREFKSKHKDILMINDFFDEKFIKNHKKRYDLIYSSDVIEHVPDPVKFLVWSSKLIKKKGLIVTVTSDFDSILTKLLQVKPTEHLIYLNKRNIKIIYKKAGLKLLEVKNVHRFYNVQGMLYSTTFTDKNNTPDFMLLVKLINILHLNKLIEFILSLFKEDLLIVAQK